MLASIQCYKSPFRRASDNIDVAESNQASDHDDDGSGDLFHIPESEACRPVPREPSVIQTFCDDGTTRLLTFLRTND